MRTVESIIEDIKVTGSEPLGPGLVTSVSDMPTDQKQWDSYRNNLLKCFKDGPPTFEQAKANLAAAESNMKLGELSIADKVIGKINKVDAVLQSIPEPTGEEMGKKEDQAKHKKRAVTVILHELEHDELYVEGNSVLLEVPTNNLGEAGKRILEEVIPEVVELFLNKSNDYKNAHESLGPKAQYVDLHRKMGKLKSALWDGQELQYEQVDEILMDLAGHVFLALDGINKENNK